MKNIFVVGHVLPTCWISERQMISPIRCRIALWFPHWNPRRSAPNRASTPEREKNRENVRDT